MTIPFRILDLYSGGSVVVYYVDAMKKVCSFLLTEVMDTGRALRATIPFVSPVPTVMDAITILFRGNYISVHACKVRCRKNRIWLICNFFLQSCGSNTVDQTDIFSDEIHYINSINSLNTGGGHIHRHCFNPKLVSLPMKLNLFTTHTKWTVVYL